MFGARMPFFARLSICWGKDAVLRKTLHLLLPESLRKFIYSHTYQIFAESSILVYVRSASLMSVMAVYIFRSRSEDDILSAIMFESLS